MTGGKSILRKLRPDLQWSPHSEGANPNWVARDPVSLDYYYFSDLEKRLLHLLDGRRTLGEALEHSPASSIHESWLAQLVGRADAANLLIVHDDPARGKRIWQNRLRTRSRTRLLQFLSPLAIRVKLFDPTWLLERLSPLATLLFSRTVALISLLTVFVVGYFVAVELMHGGYAKLTHAVFTQINAERAVIMLAIYLVTKSLHELGHALACKKWKAECHEIGIFFLVFAPCLYCDTTDGWKLSSRWRRAAISAAGIYVEWMLATLAGAVWLLTQPTSSLHWAAAYMMIIGSISTVLVNANPLLRYDGYYILSDVWNVPNLADRSRECLRAATASLLTGSPFRWHDWDASPWGLIVYSIAAKIYRILLLFVILSFVWIALDKIGLRLIGVGLIALMAVTMILGTVTGTIALLREVSMSGRIRLVRAAVVLAVLAAGLWSMFNVQWTTYVSSRAVATLTEMSPVYARQTGRLVSFQPLGENVTRGSSLLELQSPELERELIEVEGQIAALEQKLTQLRISLVDDERAAFELGNTVEEIAAYRARQKILKEEITSLVVVAPHAGKLIPSDTTAPLTFAELDHTGTWNPLLSYSHLGATIERGTLLGWLALSDSFELRALIPEHDAERIHPGMRVLVRWDCEAGTGYEGEVVSVAPEPIKDTPPSLVGDPSFLSGIDRDGRQAPLTRHYEVLIHTSDVPVGITHRSLATAHIATPPSTLWDRAYRFYSLNIRPQLVNRR